MQTHLSSAPTCRAHSSPALQAQLAAVQEGRWTPSDALTDIRFDEDYEKFYAAQLGAGQRLPRPLDHRTILDMGAELQGLTPQQRSALMSRLSPAPNGHHNPGRHPHMLWQRCVCKLRC